MNFNMDLEERILQKNVPGRYTSWDLEQDDCRNEGEDDGTHNSEVELVGETSSNVERAKYNVHSMQNSNNSKSYNTGAKGIMNDYKYHKALEKQQRLLKQEQMRDILHRQVTGACLAKGEISFSRSAQIQRDRIEKSKLRDVQSSDEGSSNDDSSDSDTDSEFVNLYRKKRMEELYIQNKERAQFGEICEVTPFEFSTIIDEADPCIQVVVHLYEPTLSACEVLNRRLENVARSMAHVQFLRLQVSQASSDFDPIVLPTLMVYRAGDLVHNLIRVPDELPCGYDAKDVEQYLNLHGSVY